MPHTFIIEPVKITSTKIPTANPQMQLNGKATFTWKFSLAANPIVAVLQKSYRLYTCCVTCQDHVDGEASCLPEARTLRRTRLHTTQYVTTRDLEAYLLAIKMTA